MQHESNLLLPCPFCGSTGAIIKEESNFYGFCGDCETEGPWSPMHDRAVAAWNTRATAAPVVSGEVVAWWNGDIDSYPVTNRDLAERLGYRRPLYERPALAGGDEAMAMHWIDRYAVGIDDEPQMDRIREALGCKEAGNAD